MIKKIIVSILFVTFLFCINIVEAKQYKVSFENLSKETVVYYLYQIDHDIKHISKPIAFVIGTLKPGDYWSTSREEKKQYFLEWRSENDELLMKLEPFYLNKNISFKYLKQEK